MHFLNLRLGLSAATLCSSQALDFSASIHLPICSLRRSTFGFCLSQGHLKGLEIPVQSVFGPSLVCEDGHRRTTSLELPFHGQDSGPRLARNDKMYKDHRSAQLRAFRAAVAALFTFR